MFQQRQLSESRKRLTQFAHSPNEIVNYVQQQKHATAQKTTCISSSEASGNVFACCAAIKVFLMSWEGLTQNENEA